MLFSSMYNPFQYLHYLFTRSIANTKNGCMHYYTLSLLYAVYNRIEWRKDWKRNTIFHFISIILCFVAYFFFLSLTCKPKQNTKKNMLKHNFFSGAARYVDKIWSYTITWIESWSGKKHNIKYIILLLQFCGNIILYNILYFQSFIYECPRWLIKTFKT